MSLVTDFRFVFNLCLAFSLFAIPIAAQEKEGGKSKVPHGWESELPLQSVKGCICCFDGELPDSGKLYSRPPSSGIVDSIVSNILSYAGLAPNFKVLEVDDDNAYAMIREGERILGFGDRYLKAISSKAGTDWGRLGVMAHEVGHHVQGHTVRAAEEPERSHQRELEADEYAGFICGMMGSSREDASGHTALMSEEGSDSHPPRSERIAATERGWLRAQHIRRSVKEEKACPVFRFTGSGFEQFYYTGRIGDDPVDIQLSRSPEGTLFGTYNMDENGFGKQFRFMGRSSEPGSIRLEEYFGCEPSAVVTLAKASSREGEKWSGTLVEPTGDEFEVEVVRSLKPPPRTEPPAPEEPDAIPDPHFLTTMAGFSERWFPVVSKGSPYVDQIVSATEEFPEEWMIENFNEGYRITHVAGDANGWAVTMSAGTGYGSQRFLGPGPIDETAYSDLRDSGYRITAVAGYADTWVMILSENSGLGNQRFTKVGEFNVEWIDARLREGYRLTQVAGDDDESGGSWLAVVSEGTGWGDQAVSDGDGFPADWITQAWDEGYRITAASGYDNWRVVMTKDTGLTVQTYQNPSSEFPLDFIQAERGRTLHSDEVAKALKSAEGKLSIEPWPN